MSITNATLDWLETCLSLGRESYHAEFVTMTREVAAAILERNPNNRHIQVKLASFMSDLRDGRWSMNGESIIISKEGLLNDGQHRLLAIVKTGISMPVTVVFGVERATRVTVDQGTARCTKDYLAMQGESNATALAAIANIVMTYEAGDGLRFAKTRDTTNSMMLERAMRDDLMKEAASWSAAHSHHLRGICRPAVLGAAYYLFSRINRTDARGYMQQVLTGENIARGDPAFAVRSALITVRVRTAANLLEIIMRGWAAYRKRDNLILAKVMGNFPPLEQAA